MAKLVRTLAAYVFSICMMIPFLWMISTSFKEPSKVFNFPIEWIPNPANLNGYRSIWSTSILGVSFFVFYINSIKVALFALVGTFITCSLSAYGFAKINFAGKRIIFMLLISTMMVPFQVIMIPTFVIYREFGLLNTHAALWLPYFFGSIFGVFLLRQFMMALPQELSEAAFLDGAGHLKIYWRIVLPLTKPALTALMILTLVANWNNYESPLLFIRSPELYTIPVGLKAMSDDVNTINYTGVMAGVVSSIIPIFLLFIFGQRYFVQGITFSAIKG